MPERVTLFRVWTSESDPEPAPPRLRPGHRRRPILSGLLRCLPAALLAGAAAAAGPVFAAAAAPNAWHALGPDGGGVGVLAIDPLQPATVYAGTHEGIVFGRTSGGGNWLPLISASSGVSAFDVHVLAVVPSQTATVLAGTDEGLLESLDGGGSWQVLYRPGQQLDDFTALVFDPSQPRAVYAACNAGVCKSLDRGVSWKAANAGLTDYRVNALVIDPANPTTLYAGTSCGGMFKSSDGGASWAATNLGFPIFACPMHIVSLVIDPVLTGTLYAATVDFGIYKSTDAGLSWLTVNSGIPNVNTPLDPKFDVYLLAIDPSHPSTLYAGGVAHSFKSMDGGNSWTEMAGLAGAGVGAFAIDPSKTTTIYAGTANGLLASTDGGASWSPFSSGISALVVPSVAVDPASSATLYIGTGHGLFKSAQGGAGWTAIHSATIVDLEFDPTSPTVLYAAAGPGGLLKSGDGGATWTVVGPPGAAISTVAIDPTNSAILYAGASFPGGVFKTSDGGRNWTPVNSGIPIPAGVLSLAIDPGTPATLYAGLDRRGTNDCGIFKSTNAGTGWSPATCGNGGSIYGNAVLHLAVDPGSPATVYAGTLGAGVLKTTNAGASWTAANSGLPGAGAITGLAFDPRHTGTLYASGYSNGGNDGSPDDGEVFRVWKTTDGGGSWLPVGSAGPEALAWSLAFDPKTSRLYAGTRGQSLYALTDAVTCAASPATLCLDDQPGDGRFEVKVHYQTAQGVSRSGDGQAIGLSSLGVNHGGLFWFFAAVNPEMLVKLIDACAINQQFWVFSSAATNVGFTTTIRDTRTGSVKTYTNPDLTAAPPAQDTSAFSCSGGSD
jgi:photosystem II stability/assembly factor-like uncharacterized protein